MISGAPSQRPDEPILTTRRGFWLVIALYVLISAVIWLNFDGPTRLKYSGDGDSWYQPSIGLYLHGGFVYPESPDTPSIYRPPAFPVFAAAMFSIAGGPSPNAIAVGQIVLLLLVGLIFRATVNDWLPGWGDIGMGLFIFNPNVLTIAQYVQSDTLFLFFVTIAMWAMLRYARGETGWRYPVLVGVALALACLTRPTAQFLILVLPLAFPLLDVVNGNGAMWRRGLLKGAAATVLALLVLFPWAHHVKQLEGSYGLSSAEIRSRYIWDQISIIEAQHSGLSYHEAENKQPVQYAVVEARYGEKWKAMNESQRHAAILREGYDILLSYPASELAVAYARSIIQFFAAGGSGRWHYLLLDDPDRLAEAWFRTKQTDVAGMVARFLGGTSPVAIVASAVCIVFAVVARLVGLIGLVAIARRRSWAMLLTIVSIISYFALVHLFVGNSRYRISIEPALMLLFLHGIEAMWRRWRSSGLTVRR